MPELCMIKRLLCPREYTSVQSGVKLSVSCPVDCEECHIDSVAFSISL